MQAHEQEQEREQEQDQEQEQEQSMRGHVHNPRYNRPIRQMRGRASSGLRIGWLILNAFAVLFSPSLLVASNLSDAARLLGDRIAAVTGPGAIALDVSNRSSLDERSVRDVRSALEAQLRVQGIKTIEADQAMGTVTVLLSESLREYVWTAQVAVGTDRPRVVMVSLPRSLPSAAAASALPVTLKKTFLFSQEQAILDAAVIAVPGAANGGALATSPTAELGNGARLLLLDATRVAVYRQQAGRWEPETSLPITHARIFPRDTRGRLVLRRDHLFDAYLPGTVCRSTAAMPLTLSCTPSEEPWPLTPDDNGVRAFFAPTRNFFTGTLSPGIGKLSIVPAFYSAADLPRSSYTLWVLAAVDGSVHVIDGFTDQATRGGRAGSDIASVRSNCGVGAQVLVSDAGDPVRDALRAFEIPDREPVAVSAPFEFEGKITALWPEADRTNAVAIVKRADTGWYEANRISISCSN